MTLYIAMFFMGLVVFFGTHLFTTFRKRGEGDIKARMGRPYMGVYSLITGVGFVLMVWGYGMIKPWIPVWDPPVWTRHIVITFMPVATILLAAAYAPVGYIKKTVKHPMLAAVKLWAVLHLAANGDLATIILCAAFLVYAVIDRIALARRGDKGPVGVKPTLQGDLLAVAIGLGAYVVIVFWLHTLLVGVPVVAWR